MAQALLPPIIAMGRLSTMAAEPRGKAPRPSGDYPSGVLLAEGLSCFIAAGLIVVTLALMGCFSSGTLQLGLRRYTAASPTGPVIYYVGTAPGSKPHTRALLYLHGTSGPTTAEADFGNAAEATLYGYDVVYPERRHVRDPARFYAEDSRQTRMEEASAVFASLVERGVNRVLVFAESEATMFAPELTIMWAANTVGLVCVSGSVTPFAQDLLWVTSHSAHGRHAPPLRADPLASEFDSIRRSPDAVDKTFWGHSYHFWSSYLDYDPVPDLRRVSFPVLYVNGEFDDIDIIRQVTIIGGLKSEGSDIEEQVLKGQGHELGQVRLLLVKRIVEWAQRKGLI